MIKRLILAVLLVAPFFAQAQQVKLGKIDKVAVYNAMPEKVEAETQLAALNEQYQNEYKMLQAEFNRKYADYQALALDNKTPGTIKERRMKELQENNDKIEQFMKQTSADLNAKEAELVGPLKQKLDDAIKAVGDEEGFLVIYDVNEPGVVYLGNGFEDITPVVMKKLGIQQ